MQGILETVQEGSQTWEGTYQLSSRLWLAGRLELLATAREVLHEVPAADPSAHITSCALYSDSSNWMAEATGNTAQVFCVTANASGLLQVPASFD